MARIPAVLLSVQLVLSAFAWATGSGRIKVESLPEYVFWLAPFAGPAAILIHGTEALYVYLSALAVLAGLLGFVVISGNATAKGVMSCALVWWLLCGFAATTIGV